MLNWKELKAILEKKGLKDEDIIKFIDIGAIPKEHADELIRVEHENDGVVVY